jgi:hypothetical protein
MAASRSREFKWTGRINVKETLLSPEDLQGKYSAALARVIKRGGSKRQTPIFQREPATEKQSIQDAAKALAALWKIAKA